MRNRIVLEFALFALISAMSGIVAILPSAAAGVGVVKIGTSSLTLYGINVYRPANSLVAYTATAGQAVSPANIWGAEAAISNGKVVELRDRQATGGTGTPIPAGGVVLSGHGTARSWLLARAKVGVAVTLPVSVLVLITPSPSPSPSVSSSPSPSPSVSSSPSPSPSPSVSSSPSPSVSSSPSPSPSATADQVRADSSAYPLYGVDVYRPADALVVYTATGGRTTSPANTWGAEAAVVGGVVTELRDRQTTGAPAMPIPANGLVLSGHGAAREWLLAHARPGVFVLLPARITPASWPTTPPSPSPSPTPTCAAGRVELTFDDGPGSATTPLVLDTLRDKSVKATFFVIGRNAQEFPDLIRREVAEGHAIGNHTWSHPILTQMTAQTVSPTNIWGVEIAVVGGVVTQVWDRQVSGAAAPTIPSGGLLLSGHGAARDWLLANARVGTTVVLPNPLASGFGQVAAASGSTYALGGINTDRLADQLIVYTRITAAERVQQELSLTSDAISAITGVRPTQWRPPESQYNQQIVDIASGLGLALTLFDVDSLDYTGATAEQIRSTVLANARDGSVVDLHDMGSNTVQALPALIDDLRTAGFCLR